VCLDLLSDYTGYFQRSGISKSLYGGWSNAYSVSSILIQLQAVLLNFDLDTEQHGDYNNSDKNSDVEVII
jgi:ubiquitin-protein ligase